jgi:tRNA (mo5U34)-methyltransferase
MENDLEDRILSREWFYRYTLPSGQCTKLYIPDEVAKIHVTRLEMMMAALSPLFESQDHGLTAIDFASHQGFFSIHLASHCQQVLGLEFQQRHIDAANLIKALYKLSNVKFVQENIETMPAGRYAPADIVIMFGLLYNLENPIGVLRRARELTKKILLIETQTTILDLEGRIDSGHHASTNYMHGYFGIFAGNPENIDGSASDIVLYPSTKGLLWALQKLGFTRVEVLKPPPDAYQQLATGKRIMVKAEF